MATIMIYLDNAATSWPKPEEVYRRLDRFLRDVGANPGRSGHRRAVEAEAAIAAARRTLAALLGAPDASMVVFCLNATDALNIAIKGFLRPGDHVVTSGLEHNSITRPLTAMQSRGEITVTRVASRDGLIAAGDMDTAITPKTRLVAVTHGSNALGTIQPVEDFARLAHERGARILVDASQTAGAIPFDMSAMRLDMVAFTGHKGILGPTGTGGLALLPGTEIEPWREGGTGTDSASPVQPRDYPMRLEGGTPNAAGIAALAEGAQWVMRRTPEAIHEHELAMAGLLRELLSGEDRITFHGAWAHAAGHRRSDLERKLGIVSFTVRGVSPDVFGAALDDAFDIAVRPGLHCAPGAHQAAGTFPEGTVRASTGPFTTEEEIRKAARAILEIAQSF